MMAHTLGPWHVAQADPDLPPYVVSSVNGMVICDLTSWASSAAPSNADLVAAAPDLLALLERAVRSEHSEIYMAWDASQRPDWCKEAETLLIRLGVKA